jgi:hypothetical protein
MYAYWLPTITLMHTGSTMRSGKWPEQQPRGDGEVAAMQGENHERRGAIMKVSLQREQLKLKRHLVGLGIGNVRN